MNEARRMSRELAREIKAQELECRRLALEDGLYHIAHDSQFNSWCVWDRQARYFCYEAVTKARAVAWAEKMNKKESRKDGGK